VRWQDAYANASADSGAIFIDIGGGTTDAALVRRVRRRDTHVYVGGVRLHRLSASKGCR
jgi:cell division protein FtsA